MCPETQPTPWEVRKGFSEKGAFAQRPDGGAGLTGEGRGDWGMGGAKGPETGRRLSIRGLIDPSSCCRQVQGLGPPAYSLSIIHLKGGSLWGYYSPH